MMEADAIYPCLIHQKLFLLAALQSYPDIQVPEKPTIVARGS